MKSKATTPEEYIQSLPEEWKAGVTAIRNAVLQHLPNGYTESLGLGMISYVIPHSAYPPGYHVNPKLPLGIISIAAQKNYITLHHMGLYGGDLLAWFTTQWPLFTNKKLDMGKCCIRFKKTEDIPLELIGQLAAKLTPEKWIEIYENLLQQRR